MNAPLFEPRPLYGIGTVARLTGLKPDTLRVWERRYGLGASHKSATGRRQYTQSDLEHLQLVSSLVGDGARIGEIASSERKTLEMLLRQRGIQRPGSSVQSKPRAVFIGVGLCNWLDKHQGCISNIDARLARRELDEIDDEVLADLESGGVVVVECQSLGSAQAKRLTSLKAERVIAVCKFANQRWLEELEAGGVSTMEYPPEPGKLAFEIARTSADAEVSAGETNLGEIIGAKPRQFGASELAAALNIQSTLDCECPRHLSELITALASFEEYSSSCSIDSWQDAAVHARIYAYTGQARHLMEKALHAVLEERPDEFRAALAQQRAKGVLGNAA